MNAYQSMIAVGSGQVIEKESVFWNSVVFEFLGLNMKQILFCSIRGMGIHRIVFSTVLWCNFMAYQQTLPSGGKLILKFYMLLDLGFISRRILLLILE